MRPLRISVRNRACLATACLCAAVASLVLLPASPPLAPSYFANTGYEYNSTGGDIEIIRTAVGRYRVRFAGMGSSGGVAHVRPYGATNKGVCTIASWSHGIDVNVNVRCFGTDGAPADMLFVAHFTNRAVPGGSFAYFWADQPNAAGPYQPF